MHTCHSYLMFVSLLLGYHRIIKSEFYIDRNNWLDINYLLEPKAVIDLVSIL